VKRGQVLCEGYATQSGEPCLRKKFTGSFHAFRKGYTFEDASVISERVLVMISSLQSTSMNIVLEVRDTKRGMEELTADIPNVSEEATRELDENGLIRVGAEVMEGDILIGKITPKGETDPSPEEKLLRAIFGDKAGDVKDASLKVPPSVKGVVIDKRLFSRVTAKDKTQKSDEKVLLEKLDKEYNVHVAELKEKLIDKLFVLVSGKTSQGVTDIFREVIIPKGAKFTQKMLSEINYDTINTDKWTTDKDKNDQIKQLLHNYTIKFNDVSGIYKRKKFALTVGDELPAGIVKLAKVYIAKNVN
jgi:DNA-directed RNA polymerase subunit beta